MSDSSASNPAFDFGKFVPGFDFLKNLSGAAGKSAMPAAGSWVAPTLSVEELDKRIEELKTVQFWLDQNAMALKATIQALEVQKMTLATLKGMNFNMADVANAFKFTAPTPASASPPATTPKAATPAPAPTPAPEVAADTPPPAAVVDPMAWWGALTQQFQNIAASAVKDAAKQAAFDPANNPVADLAKDALDPAKNPAVKLAKDAISAATDMAKVATQSVAASVGSVSAKAPLAKKKSPVTVAKKAAPAAAPKAVKPVAKTVVKAVAKAPAAAKKPAAKKTGR